MSELLLTLLSTLVTVAFQVAVASSALPERLSAFPGAEGYGAVAPGGRGGRVIKVSNLNPRGPGSLQAACIAKGPRIVVFEVGGVIPGNCIIEHGAISIFGQTAPEPGITIDGMLASRYGSQHPIDDIIVQFVRVRPSAAKGAGGDAIQFSQNRRVILDHVSCSWASDETIDIYEAQDVTIQWCTIEESLVAGHDNIYVAGTTRSADFPTTAGAYDEKVDTSAGTTRWGYNSDIFVAKFSPTGKLLWSTVIGGPNSEEAYGLVRRQATA